MNVSKKVSKKLHEAEGHIGSTRLSKHVFDACRRWLSCKYIAKEGLKFIIPALFLSIFFLFLYFYSAYIFLVPVFLFLFLFFLIIFLFNVYFFRDPDRKPDFLASEGEIISPADGKVIFLQKVYDDRFLNAEAFKISIFMSLFNVHVNRIPVSGRVEKIIYNKGKFFSANLDKASSENEFNAVVLNIKNDGYGNNLRMVFVQIAGLVARRIVCKIRQGDEVKRGNRFGLIQFGSRLDLYLPMCFEPQIKMHDRVFSGKSILGKIIC